MLSVISLLTLFNILAGVAIGVFLLQPINRTISSFKFVHLSVLLISILELFYLALLEADTNIWSKYGLLTSIIVQIIWSCVLLYNSFHLKCLGNRNSELETELTQHQQLYEELKSMALSDSLTNIANRRSFDMFLKAELHRAATLYKPVSLIIMDLDRFKNYNDTFGHITGDKLLAQMGQLLLHHVRPVDLPARYGGEEFSIILPDLDLEGATKIAENLRSIIEASNFPDNAGTFTAKITASFGVATYDPCALLKQPTPEKIIAIADKALYRSKQQGRNQVFAATILQ